MTLRQYKEFNSIEDPTEEDLLRCFSNLSSYEISDLSLDEFNKKVEDINSKLNKDYPLAPRFILNGVEYGFIPNIDEITYGENKDLTSYVGSWDTMHRAMAVAYRPIEFSSGKKYLIQKYRGTSETADVMLDAPFEVVAGMLVFFYTLTNDLLSSIPNYLQEEMTKKDNQHLVKNGQAIENYISSLKEILPSSTK